MNRHDDGHDDRTDLSIGDLNPKTSATTRRTVLKVGALTVGVGTLGLGVATVAAQDGPGGTPPAGGLGGPPEGGGQDGSETLDAFVGITTDGNVIPDLFPLQASGVDVTPVIDAANAFLATLSDEQKAATQFAIDDDEWRKWSNVDGYQRQGISLREMNDDQKTAGYELLSVSLSASGFEKTQNTIKLNHTEGELMGNFDSFDEDLYWFTIMGEPSDSEPWGWQLDGHHLVINYSLSGDQLVMTPVFMGAEPTIAPEGTDYAGLSVMIPEQDKGLSMVVSLTEAQQAKAIISAEKSGEDMKGGANSDNAVIAYEGINASELTAEQQTQFLDLIAEWVSNLDDGHAAIKMADVEAHLDETYFAWIGDTGDEAVFYYRIQSPVILIEFDHQEPGPLGRASNYYQGATGPQRAHVHSIVRTPNGNDYGKDLLAEHYATSPHHAGTPSAATAVATGALVIGGMLVPRPMLPPRSWSNKTVLVYDADGNVA